MVMGIVKIILFFRLKDCEPYDIHTNQNRAKEKRVRLTEKQKPENREQNNEWSGEKREPC